MWDLANWLVKVWSPFDLCYHATLKLCLFLFLYFCDVKMDSLAFGKWCFWFLPVSSVLPFRRKKIMAHWHSRFFYFCFPRPSSPLFSTLPQSLSTKDFWLLGEIQTLNGDDLSREHLAALFSWHFLSVKALLKCEKGKIWKYWLLDWSICSALLNLTMICVKLLVRVPFFLMHIPHTEDAWICLFQLLHYLHYVPCLLPGVGQRC